MNRKTQFIINAAHMGPRSSRWERLSKIIRENFHEEFETNFTGAPHQGTTFTRELIKSGCTLIVVIGGDGSINEAVNGFFEDGKLINPEASLGIIPNGTGNDLVKTLSIPTNPRSASRLLSGAEGKFIDVGKATYSNFSQQSEERYFINMAEFGYGAEVVEKVNRTSKRLGGRISFLRGILATLNYSNQPIHLSIDSKEVIQGAMRNVAVANGRFFGGGLCPAPKAEVDDGYFDIVCFGNISNAELLVNLPKLIKGTHRIHPKVQAYKGKKVLADSDQSVLLELDGDVVGTLPAQFSILPKALRIRA